MAGESLIPYDLATQGQNSFSPFTLSIQGQLTLEVSISIEDIIVEEPIRVYGGTESDFGDIYKKKKKKKIIKVTVTIEDKIYEKSVITENLKIKLEDIKVSVNRDTEIPTINIEF